MQNLEQKKQMTMRDGQLTAIMQHQEEDKAQKSIEKKQRPTTSTLVGKDLLLVQPVLYLHLFLQSPIPQKLVVASKVTTLATDSMFFFAYCLLHLQAVFRVNKKNTTVNVGYLWYLGCILHHLIFGSPLFNVDSQQNNSLMSVFIHHFFRFFAMFKLLL